MIELIEKALQEIESRGQLRTLKPAQLAGPGRLVRSGEHYLDFSSNDYLGLSRHPLLIERSRAYAAEFGAGAGASRLVTGTSELHLAIERKIAAFKGTEAALIFATGWQANAAIIPALLKAMPGAVVFTDELVHASIHQGCRAARIRPIRLAHNNLDELEALLAEHGAAAQARIIITESVFSMDGDRANVGRLSELAREHRAMLMLDEAHATGVLGPSGAGLSAAHPGAAEIVVGTFSKALGGFGAYVACSQVLRDYLVNACSGFVYSTAPPPSVLGAMDAALELVPGLEAERAHLDGLGAQLRVGLQRLGFGTLRSSTQIIPLVIGPEATAMELAARLERSGFLAIPIRPPTVPPGTSRLRLALRAAHQPEDIDRLLNAIAEGVQ